MCSFPAPSPEWRDREAAPPWLFGPHGLHSQEIRGWVTGLVNQQWSSAALFSIHITWLPNRYDKCGEMCNKFVLKDLLRLHSKHHILFMSKASFGIYKNISHNCKYLPKPSCEPVHCWTEYKSLQLPVSSIYT